MTITIFWDITPCSPLKVNRRFEVTYLLHIQGRKTLLATCFDAGFCLGAFLDPEYGGEYFPAKRVLTFNGQHKVIAHKTALFITTIQIKT
jgi:hypothetical protein